MGPVSAMLDFTISTVNALPAQPIPNGTANTAFVLTPTPPNGVLDAPIPHSPMDPAVA
jgi:hypothetical protein